MRSVLIIEDSRELREAMKMVLQMAGYTVYEAAQGRAGMAQQRAHPADVVVTDINMPDMDGFETIEALKAEYPGVKIIATSGGMSQMRKLDTLRAAEQMGALSCLRKPFGDQELVKAVQEALASP
jgi:CheY-like chemotaxis protein